MENILEISKNLSKKLVFTKFGELSAKQKQLYTDYLMIDEAAEINKGWLDFSSDVVNHLLSILSLTKSLFERILDEFKRQPDKISDEDTIRIQSITDFWLDLSMMAYLYSTIQKSGVMKQQGTNKRPPEYFDTKIFLEQLTQLSFSNAAFFSTDARLTLFEILKLDELKLRILMIKDEQLSEIISSDEFSEILGQYDQGQALFLLNNVRIRISESFYHLWWQDPIAMNASVEHGLFHLEQMKKTWQNTSSNVSMPAIAFYQQAHLKSKLMSDAYLSLHYKTLGINALKKLDYEIAASYFRQAREITTSIGKDAVVLLDRIESWSNVTVKEQLQIYRYLESIANVVLIYDKLMNVLAKEDSEVKEIQKEIERALDILANLMKVGDLPYLSQVAFMFETVFIYLNERLDEAPIFDRNKCLFFINQRFFSLIERFSIASKQITKEWIQGIKEDPNDVKRLYDLTRNLDFLQFSFLLIPEKSEDILALVAEIDAIQLATDTMASNNIANEEFGRNPVKELMIRAKGFYLVQEAIHSCNVGTHKEMLNELNTLLEPIGLNALLRGLIAEIQLKTALLQFQFFNYVAPVIQNSVLSETPILQMSSQFDISALEKYKTAIDEIAITVTTLLKYKVPISIKGSPVNWQYFSILNSSMQALNPLIDATINSIDAMRPSETKKRNDRIAHWSTAKEKAKVASELIAKIEDQETAQLSVSLYNFSQLFREYEQKVRDGKEVTQFPTKMLLDLIQKLSIG